MDVKTRWNSTLEFLEWAYRFPEFTCQWLKNPKYSEFQPLYTIQDEWTIVKYVIEVLRTFQYWTLWMSKAHTVTGQQVITVYNNMFDHMNGVMQALARKVTQWNKDLFCAMKCAGRKMSQDYTEVTPMTGMLLSFAHILDPFRKLPSFKKWDKGMDIIPKDETSDTTQYQQAFLKYVQDEYCGKHRCLPIAQPKSVPTHNLFSSAIASRSGQSSYNLYDLSSNDEEYQIPENVAETTPRQSNRAAHLRTAARLYLISPP